ncbi:tRNA (5-methylaminomethyl-2-thiouridine)(34)-methyltransferase MnmD [Roseovarius sp. C7]|uniref:tRNA (5-methylaminomethyl-2-thiouridine)(34)-methyltransferase MnmD n=1 Tax=Roseovarius sp. C7 TaxID=3398643 RepID=UPI0039F6E544
MQGQRAKLEWRDGDVPVSQLFDDPYYSLENGLDETRHVFLAGNGLPDRFRDGFAIAELGFGTGLNALTTCQAWRAAGAPGVLRFTSFEAFPMAAEDMARALAHFPELADLAAPLVAGWAAGARDIALPGNMQLQVIEADARDGLPGWEGRADAWYLDGFSPAKNPELWGPDLLQAVYDHSAPGGTLATYTAAGFVRRGLADAGFEVSRVSGYGRKRHMTVARNPST